MWSELSEHRSSFPACLHLHFNAACVPIQLEIQAELRLGSLQAEIGEGQARIRFATWGKYELSLSSLEYQGMPGLTRDPFPYRGEEGQTKMDGSHPQREYGEEYPEDIHCRSRQLSER